MAWCPKCKCEYVEGVDRCADCGCELVEHLTDEPEERFTESLPESPEEEIAAAQLAVMEPLEKKRKLMVCMPIRGR